ncbi:hypothetical protein [Herbaspirillum sp. 1130]|uniref:hypothetical protein n=1 Tax=Herbaspirillum sp. 1130 TaxID=2806562 RepID=UPI001AE43896|nr:hypothetical protein [Herbaspirillum sp. 1130]MBP1316189.1 antitoxin YefM [Herbaspirillum sp. 1130]
MKPRQPGDDPNGELVSHDCFSSPMETAHLSRSPANVAHLERSIAQLRAAKIEEKKLDE